MSDSFLLWLFAIHMGAFGLRFLVSKKLRHLRITILFGFLTLYYATLWTPARFIAWTLAAWSIGSLLIRLGQRFLRRYRRLT